MSTHTFSLDEIGAFDLLSVVGGLLIPQTVYEELLDVTGPTAYRAIGQLEEKGVLEETTGKQRNREYRAREIFEILERPSRTYQMLDGF